MTFEPLLIPGQKARVHTASICTRMYDHTVGANFNYYLLIKDAEKMPRYSVVIIMMSSLGLFGLVVLIIIPTVASMIRR